MIPETVSPAAALYATPKVEIAAQFVNVPYMAQQMSKWCWAATVQMIVMALQQQEPRQCVLANYELQRNDCCPTNQVCNVGSDDITGLLMTFGISSKRMQYNPPFEKIVALTEAGRPLVYQLLFAGGDTHVAIISGAAETEEGQWVYFLDPDAEFFQQQNRAPYGWVPFEYILGGYNAGGNWLTTWYDIY